MAWEAFFKRKRAYLNHKGKNIDNLLARKEFCERREYIESVNYKMLHDEVDYSGFHTVEESADSQIGKDEES